MTHSSLFRTLTDRSFPGLAHKIARTTRQLELRTRFPETDGSRLERLNQIFKPIARNQHPLHGFYTSQGLGKNAIKLDTLEDLRQIPVIDKSLLKEWHAEGRLYANVPEGAVFSHTSGSTGRPFMTAVDMPTARLRSLVETKFQALAGLQPHMREMRIWRQKSFSNCQRDAIQRGDLSYVFIDSAEFAHLSDSERMHRIAKKIREFRPAVIKGYAGVIANLAASLLHQSEAFPRPQIVLPVAEYLSKQEWELCERVFECPVINLYGGTETPAVAQSGGSKHPFEAARHLYLLEASPLTHTDSVTDPREIIVTDLSNRAMPLIRYKNGDLCITSGANQSFDLAEITEIIGRKNDVITFPDNRSVSPHVWFVALRDLTWLLGFEIHQDATGCIEIRYFPEQDAPSTARQEIEFAASKICHGYLTSITQINKQPTQDNVKRKVITSCYRAVGTSQKMKDD